MSGVRAAEPNAGVELPPDNAARVALFDAMHDFGGDPTSGALTDDQLFECVIGRLRVLVPRELHVTGERAYFEAKLDACVQAGVLSTGSENGQRLVRLTGTSPLIRYPDGVVRDYEPGLELAREHLDADNARLRSRGFDVRTLVPSAADDVNGAVFQGLLASMAEHGFLKQFPLVRYDDDAVVDGRARLRAAAMLGLDVEYLRYGSDRDRTFARRRDTPLNRVMLALQANFARLTEETVQAVHARVAAITGRSWQDTVADMALTARWRLSVPPEYSPRFEVRKLAFRDREEAKVQVTADGKVMLRSLLEAGGLSNYKIAVLRDYVPFERARSVHSAGRKAVFARAQDLIAGIAAMQHERRATKLKLDPEWEQIRQWLIRMMGPDGGDRDSLDAGPNTALPAVSPAGDPQAIE